MSRVRAAALVAGLVIALPGCSLLASSSGPPPAEIVASPGATFTVVLDANHSTGFAWELAKPLDTDVLTHAGTTYEQGTRAAAGAGGREVWTFTAVAPGWAKIELAYRRPWEDMAPARLAVYSVDVE